MRKGYALLLLLVVLASAWPVGRAPAQDPPPGVTYSRLRHFRIPITFGPGRQRLRQLQLFYSTDQGRTWLPAAVVPPEQDHFSFICDRDGLYWFTVQTVEQDGRRFPPTLDGAQPSLQVVVDTQPPTVQLQPLPARNGEVGVAWEVRDDNLDLKESDSLRLEYRPAGGAAWTALPVSPAANQYYWNAGTAAPVEVRLRARDRAGNVGEATTTLIAGQSQGGPGGQPQAAPTPQGVGLPFGFPGGIEHRLVNSKRISLNYELKEVGPSGVSTVELWYTQDGRSWNKYPLPRAEDGAALPKPLVFEVNGEGVYGFTLVARSGVGLGERPPQIGDRPQVWVEVDLTKPVVQLQGVFVGQGEDKGKLTITWSARDKNLGRSPITLSYAEQSGGPWRPIAEHLENGGRHVWKMPDRVPYQFLVRVEAVDEAGNVGTAVTPEMVKVDLSQPKVRIVTVEPAGH
jgi:hypothetical protein